MRNNYGPWQPCWISNQHQKHKSGRGHSLWSLGILRYNNKQMFEEWMTNDNWTTESYKYLHNVIKEACT
jgi:hypothetical protein